MSGVEGSRIPNPNGKELYKYLDGYHSVQALSTGNPTHWPSDPGKITDMLDVFLLSGMPRQIISITGSDDLSSDIIATVNTECI